LNLGRAITRLLMVIAQEPTQSLAAFHGALAENVSVAREQQDIALTLMIPLSMEIFEIFAEGALQGALTDENHLGQQLLLHRPDPALTNNTPLPFEHVQCTWRLRAQARADTRPRSALPFTNHFIVSDSWEARIA
jgi:hypothetical protein